MAKKKAQNAKDAKLKAVEAALSLAAEKGWEQVSLRDIAQEAGIPFAALHGYFDDKSDILAVLGRLIDAKVLESVSEPDEEMSPRERLFDVLMERYDALNDYRAGIVAVLDSFRYDPKQVVVSMPHVCKSMVWMLEAAGVEANGLRGALKVAGLTGVYIKVLRVWAQDESADLSRTMAALDKVLSRAERVAETLNL